MLTARAASGAASGAQRRSDAMKLALVSAQEHGGLVSAVGWDGAGELLSAADDKQMRRWSAGVECLGTTSPVDAYVIELQWNPATRMKAANEYFVCGCSDGNMRLVSKAGRVEKTIDAHKGAVVCVRWSHDGTTLASSGEDGSVKTWSKSGMLRSTLVTTDRAIYSLAWSPDSDAIVYTSNHSLVIKPMQPTQKPTSWKAHDAPIVKVDWNNINNLIVSGAEDRKYKVWDHFGRLLFACAPLEHTVTSLSWAPDGESFAVGSFNLLRVCDKTGFAVANAKHDNGSAYSLAWSGDSTSVAAGTSDGSVFVATLIERSLQYKNYSVFQPSSSRLVVQDALSDAVEELDLKGKIVKLSMAFDHMIAATTSHMYLYNTKNWTSPHIVDLKEPVNFIVQAESRFIIVSNTAGVLVYTYDGRLACSPRSAGVRPEFLCANSVSLSTELVAICDRSNARTIVLFDGNGKPMDTVIKHSQDVVELDLEKAGNSSDRLLYFIDANRDLYVTPAREANPIKVGTMVESACWHEQTSMLSALMDRQFAVWYYPQGMLVDRDLMVRTKVSKDGSEYGKRAEIVLFSENMCSIRRADGAMLSASVSPFPSVLFHHASRGEWEQAIRLCRFVKDDALWGCLAGMAINGRELNTAEAAYAAIKELDKVHYISHVKNIPTEEGRSAELAVFSRNYRKAEMILLQAQLFYRAIKMNIRLFRWERALSIAVKHKTHVDTVIAYRQKYLESIKQQESNQHFVKYGAQVTVDWETIKTKIAKEKEEERLRPGARPYG